MATEIVFKFRSAPKISNTRFPLHKIDDERSKSLSLSHSRRRTMQVAGAITDLLVALPSTAGYRLSEPRGCHFFPESKSFGICPSFGISKLVNGMDKHRMKGFIVRASSNSNNDLAPIAPVHLDSPVGQLLEQILQTHPHLLPAAVDQQLEQLQNDRDAKKEESSSSSEDLLYKRIAEVKEKERQKTLEEIMYCSVIHKFVEKEIALIPKITSTSDPTGRVDFWPNQEMKLESVHSPEAFEMVQGHLALIIGDRQVGPLQNTIEISKVKLGKLYAASIMYGYFLRRVDQRYQLERSMKTLPREFSEREARFEEQGSWDPDLSMDGKSHELRTYVTYLDSDTLQRYATIRSPEAISLIEKQTQALFGRPDIRVAEDGSLETGNDEMVVLTFAGLTMLVLEAVAFGSFLWDAEDYIESKYQFIRTQQG